MGRTGTRAHFDRVVMFDAMRCVAAIAVIYFHSIESDALRISGVLGRSSVPFYTMAAIVFLVQGIRRHPERGLLDYAVQRFRRLYLPFIGWSLITAAVLMLLHAWDPWMEVPSIELNALVSGLALPLWFIPFILVGGILLFPVAKWALGSRRRELLVAAAAGVLALTLDWIPWNDPPLRHVALIGRLFEVSWNRWSSLYWGLALAILYTRWLKSSPIGRWFAWGGLGLLVSVTVWQWNFGMTPGFKALSGLGLCLVAFAPWQGQILARLGQLAPLSFGMYMSHTIWIAAARALAHTQDWPSCWQTDLFVFFVAVTASILTVRVLATSPALAWLTGREPAMAGPMALPVPARGQAV